MVIIEIYYFTLLWQENLAKVQLFGEEITNALGPVCATLIRNLNTLKQTQLWEVAVDTD